VADRPLPPGDRPLPRRGRGRPRRGPGAPARVGEAPRVAEEGPQSQASLKGMVNNQKPIKEAPKKVGIQGQILSIGLALREADNKAKQAPKVAIALTSPKRKVNIL